MTNTPYPPSILYPIGGASYFHFHPAVSYLFSLVTTVDLEDIKKCKVYKRSYPQYLPWYSTVKGGGAITLGNGRWSRIYFTENFFSADQDYYKGNGYLDKPNPWLRLASHEVTHIGHGKRFGSIIIYLIIFIYQYVIYGHDKAPLEIEADAGTSRYHRFNQFVVNRYKISLADIIASDSSDDDKCRLIEKYWLSHNE